MSDDQDPDSKTEEPTEKRLSQARDEGQWAVSQELKHLAVLFAGTLIVAWFSPWMATRLQGMLIPAIEAPHLIRVTTVEELQTLMGEWSLGLFLIMAGPWALLLVAIFSTSQLQQGWMMVTKNLKPDLKKLNPLQGFKRIFSPKSVIELVKSVAKIIVVGGVGAMVIIPRLDDMPALIGMELGPIALYIHDAVTQLLLWSLAPIALIAAADYFYQRHTFMKNMRMAKFEVKDEHKQAEGDPLVKGKIRSLRMQKARQRMMAAVPTADVVVTNPTHFAVALKYDQETMQAPVLVAKGVDALAKRIREEADKHEVPIVENPPLARALYATVDLDREIPPEHYKAVAEVIGYVMRLKGKLRRV